MPLFVKTIALDSALPPGALLDRIRGLVAGKPPMPRRSRWIVPVMWRLREQPDGIRLMPLSPPNYRSQQPEFTGTIETKGVGSRVSGRVTPYALTVWVTVFLLLMDALIAGGGVVQEISRHHPGQTLAMASFGVVFAAAAIGFLALSVSWATADIRQLLETAASGKPHETIAASSTQPLHASVPQAEGRRSVSAVLKLAAAVDMLIALFLVTSTFISSRVGRPVTLWIAATLAIGAAVLLVVAHRLGSQRRE